MVVPRRNPTRVRPPSSASEAASEDGADTAASTGAPIMIAFCASSNDARPLTSKMCPASGSRPERSAQPATLSTALCLPTSSRRTSSVPSGLNSPAACSPPVRLKTRCASRRVSGRAASTAGETRTGSGGHAKGRFDPDRLDAVLAAHAAGTGGEELAGGARLIRLLVPEHGSWPGRHGRHVLIAHADLVHL